ncbi:MAG TPA: response regulator [Myxococcales bacterium]|jgi:DNA-binding response OmpR family regulator
MFRAPEGHGKLRNALQSQEKAHLSGDCVPRVLVIDDEPLVALMVKRALAEAHEVGVDHSAHAGVDRFARGERWDVIIADLHLADGDAIWVRDELARLDPGLPARLLVITGGASTPAGKAFLREPGVRWLQKPFRAAELLARVQEVLAISSCPA